MIEQLEDARALHGNKRRWLTIVGGNLALLVVMLGIPWLRGYLRTRELWHAYAAYGACLFGGTASEQPGLGLPLEHEARFATRAVREPGWSASCDDELSAMSLPEATFVLHAVKVAESDLRSAVTLLRNELKPLAARTPGTRLSVRPLRAFERLRAGLANHTRATGFAVPEQAAFSLDEAASVLPTPTRLPLYAGAHALVSLWGSDVELFALATDRTGISFVHISEGKMEQTRETRPKLLEAALPRARPRYFVWATSRSRCAEREQGCVDKALGIARVPYPVDEVPVPRWLGAHPSGRTDRSLWKDEQRVLVTAELADDQLELREFALDDEAIAAAQADMPPLAASTVWSTRAAGDALLLAREQGPLVLVAAREQDGMRLRELRPEGARELAALQGAGEAWVVGCADADGELLVHGHEHALQLLRHRGDELERFDPLNIELKGVIDPQDGSYDRVRPLCGAGLRALAQDTRDRLVLITCSAGEPKCSERVVASGVYSWSAVTHQGRLLVAYAGAGESAQVRVRSLSLQKPDAAPEQVPAICWSDNRGLCSTPTLALAGERVLLGARESTDMRVLESADAGLSWIPLRGLAKRD